MVASEREFCARVNTFCIFLLFSIGIALICSAFATQHWFTAHPVRDAAFRERAAEAAIEGSKVEGGIFGGYRQLNYGLGNRRETFSVYDEISRSVSYMSLSVWLCVVVSAVLAVILAVAGLIFALINTVVKPADTITGPIGLFIWSGAAFTLSAISLLFFLVNYYTSMTQTVLLMTQERQGFTTENRIDFGFSFYLMVAACASFLLIFVLLCLSAIHSRLSLTRTTKNVHVDGAVLMY